MPNSDSTNTRSRPVNTSTKQPRNREKTTRKRAANGGLFPENNVGNTSTAAGNGVFWRRFLLFTARLCMRAHIQALCEGTSRRVLPALVCACRIGGRRRADAALLSVIAARSDGNALFSKAMNQTSFSFGACLVRGPTKPQWSRLPPSRPHRPRRGGAIGSACVKHVARVFQSSPPPKRRCNCPPYQSCPPHGTFNPHRPRRGGAICATRLCSRRTTPFNPHRPRRGGAIGDFVGRHRAVPLSILTAPEEAVQ